MNIILPHLVSQDIIIKCVSSLSTSIISSYKLYNVIISYSISHNDYDNYQNQIMSTDLPNKLLIASSVIKDIIKKHHSSVSTDISKSLNMSIVPISIEKIMELYKDELKIEYINIDENTNTEEFSLITHIQNNNITPNVPEPVKISLGSTIDIIDKINLILNKIHNKMTTYSKSYFKYVSKLNLSDDITQLIEYDKIFDKRLGLLLEILKIYSDVVK